MEHRDTNQAAFVLRAIGDGKSVDDAANALGITRRTITRWRDRDPEFAGAADLVRSLRRDGDAEAIDTIVAAWTRGALPVDASEPEPAERAEPAHVASEAPAGPVDPPIPPSRPRPRASEPVIAEVLDLSGRSLTDPGPTPAAARDPEQPYTRTRPPTAEEWTAEMAAIALDPNQPEGLRRVAAMIVTGMFDRTAKRSPSPAALEKEIAEPSTRGVRKSVWAEARREFLGPPPSERGQTEDSRALEIVDDAAAQ